MFSILFCHVLLCCDIRDARYIGKHGRLHILDLFPHKGDAAFVTRENICFPLIYYPTECHNNNLSKVLFANLQESNYICRLKYVFFIYFIILLRYYTKVP